MQKVTIYTIDPNKTKGGQWFPVPEEERELTPSEAKEIYGKAILTGFRAGNEIVLRTKERKLWRKIPASSTGEEITTMVQEEFPDLDEILVVLR